jgi:hypothetical protein
MTICMLPPPIEEVPKPVNNPPRILPDLSPRPIDGPAVLNTNGCRPYFFAATLTDPDGDNIYWRVFVNWHNDPRPLDSQVEVEPPNENQPARPRQIQFLIDPSDDRFGTDPVGRAQMVELLVADRPFTEDVVAPLGRVLDDYSEEDPRGLTDSFIWTVVLENEPCPTG